MIRASHLIKEYDNIKVIDDISIDVKNGEICGYIGPNGAGKTTTVKMLIGLLQPTSGEILINEMNVKNNVENIKKIIGYVPEFCFLYEPLTPKEYLSFIGRMRELDEEVIRKRVELFTELLDIRDVLNQPMVTFSKGMKQKILIISSLLHLPEVIFFDEPLNGLDAGSMLLFKELVRSLAKQNKTIFYCSHLLDIVEKMCDSIIIINKGKMLISKPMLEIKQEMDGESLEQIYNKFINKENYKEKIESFFNKIN